ncbi:MAG: hypothetical protein EA424_05825 [Planctomycetaceae bacterium]|nr:MAG: hypothetical protein EA424_05825 [Planctomycetaceae bacterium]
MAGTEFVKWAPMLWRTPETCQLAVQQTKTYPTPECLDVQATLTSTAPTTAPFSRGEAASFKWQKAAKNGPVTFQKGCDPAGLFAPATPMVSRPEFFLLKT